MGDERRILRNTGLLTAGEALGQLANLLFIAAFARTYGVAVMGEYSLAMAIGAVAGLAVGFGTVGYLLRELSQFPESTARHVATLAPWQLLFALGSLAIAAAALLLTGNLTIVMLSTIAYQLLLRLSNLYFVAFRAGERMFVPVAAELSQRLLTLLLGGWLMYSGEGAQVTVLAMLASSAALVIAGYILNRRAFGPPPASAPGQVLPLLRASWPYFGTLVLAVLYARGAPILLGAVQGAGAVGPYAAADRLLVAASLVPTLLGAAALPAMSRLAQRDADQLRPLAARLLRLMLLGTLLVAALMMAFAPDIVAIVFGASYASAVPVLRILGLIVPVQGVELLLAAQVTAQGGQHALMRNRLISLTCFFVLGPFVVYFAGSPGLALTVLFCSTVQLCGVAFLAKRASFSPLTAGLVWPALLAAAVAAALTTTFAGQPLIFRIAIFSGTLLLTGRGFGAVRSHDLRFALGLLKSPATAKSRDETDPAI